MKAILFANTDWYLYNFRLQYAQFLKDRGWDVVLMTPDGEHVEDMKQAGFRHITFNFSRKGINPLKEADTIRRIKQIYKEEKPDIVHHFTIKCVIYGSLAAEELGIRAIVNSITGLGYLFLSNNPLTKVLRSIVLKFYRKALSESQVIFENPDDADLFLSLGLVNQDNRNIIVGTGVDTDVFHPIKAPDTVPLTVLPARMIRDKGILEFVEAARIIRAQGVKARFALIGKSDDGNPTSISYDELSRWQKEGDVEWWGWQDDIVTVLSMSDIVCLPSYREGLPRILIEASACGRPIVTTDVPGCHEAVEDGVNGFIVPVKDAQALAEALLKLINDPNLRSEMGSAGRQMAEQLFSIQRVNEETYEVYQKAFGE